MINFFVEGDVYDKKVVSCHRAGDGRVVSNRGLYIIDQQQPNGKQRVTNGIEPSNNDSKYYDFCFSVCIGNAFRYTNSNAFANPRV